MASASSYCIASYMILAEVATYLLLVTVSTITYTVASTWAPHTICVVMCYGVVELSCTAVSQEVQIHGTTTCIRISITGTDGLEVRYTNSYRHGDGVAVLASSSTGTPTATEVEV